MRSLKTGRHWGLSERKGEGTEKGKTLSETRWRINGKDGAAAILGLHPSTLRARMHKLGITRPEAKVSD